MNPCQDETKGRDSGGSPSASVSTSPGPNTAAAASARQARQTARQAEIAFAEWMQRRGRRAGPSDPSAIFVTDVLNEYVQQRGDKIAAPERIAYAVLALLSFSRETPLPT